LGTRLKPNNSTLYLDLKIPKRGVHFLLTGGIPPIEIFKKFEKGINITTNLNQTIKKFINLVKLIKYFGRGSAIPYQNLNMNS
jgi:repressor of nif and glnA expression